MIRRRSVLIAVLAALSPAFRQQAAAMQPEDVIDYNEEIANYTKGRSTIFVPAFVDAPIPAVKRKKKRRRKKTSSR